MLRCCERAYGECKSSLLWVVGVDADCACGAGCYCSSFREIVSFCPFAIVLGIFLGRVGVWLGLGLEVMVLGAGAVQDVVWCDTA